MCYNMIFEISIFHVHLQKFINYKKYVRAQFHFYFDLYAFIFL
jgi:hypothetical protein